MRSEMQSGANANRKVPTRCSLSMHLQQSLDARALFCMVSRCCAVYAVLIQSLFGCAKYIASRRVMAFRWLLPFTLTQTQIKSTATLTWLKYLAVAISRLARIKSNLRSLFLSLSASHMQRAVSFSLGALLIPAAELQRTSRRLLIDAGCVPHYQSRWVGGVAGGCEK